MAKFEGSLKTAMAAAGIMMILLAFGCSKSAPGCSDESTIDTFKGIVMQKIPLQKKDIALDAIRTTSTDKDSGAHMCEASLVLTFRPPSPREEALKESQARYKEQKADRVKVQEDIEKYQKEVQQNPENWAAQDQLMQAKNRQTWLPKPDDADLAIDPKLPEEAAPIVQEHPIKYKSENTDDGKSQYVTVYGL